MTRVDDPTRREALGAFLDVTRLAILRLRVRIARPLPVALMAMLRFLDRWSEAMHQDGGR
jgi:hypothetical protein